MQLGLIPKTQLVLQGLHFLALFPMVDIRFVTSNVNVFAWEQFHYFGEHILHKGDSLWTRRQNPLISCPAFVWLEGIQLSRVQADLRVRYNCRTGVSGHLDFRHNGNVTFRCVTDQLADIVLSVKTTPGAPGVIDSLTRTFLTYCAKIHPCADLRQFRIFLDFDSPALVVGQVYL